MDNIIPTNEYTEFENRQYANPQVSLDRSNQFIDNLRATQQMNNQEIAQQTHNLGTDVPTNLGGLTGADSYFTSRYQTPQTASAINDLRKAAQASALTNVLENEQAMWKKRYQEAYNAYQKRQNNKQNLALNPSNPTQQPLAVDTNNSDSTRISEYTNGEYKAGYLYPVTDYVSDYQDANGQWWQVSAPTSTDVYIGPANNPYAYKQTNENVVTVNGKQYMYLDNVPNREGAWYRVTQSAGPGTYSAYAGPRFSDITDNLNSLQNTTTPNTGGR